MSSPKQPTAFDDLRSRYGQTIRWVITNWSVVLSGLALYSGLNALTLVVIARRVDPTEYGQYLASFALASFLVIIPGFGMDAWILTEHRGKWSSTTALWASSLRTRAILLIPWLVGMVLLAFLLPADTYPPEVLLPTIFGVALDSLLLMSYAILRTEHRHKRVTLVQAAYSVTLLSLSLLLPIEDGQIALFAVARTLLSLLMAVIVLVSLGRAYLRYRDALTPIRSILTASRVFMLSELASAAYIKADLTIISLVLGTEGTSIYGPAITLLQAAFLVPAALFFVMVPVLSRTYKEDIDNFLARGKAQTAVQVVLGLVISVFTFLLAPLIVDLVFGEEYYRSATVLRILSPLPLIRSLNFAFAAILTSCNRQSDRTRVQIIAAGVNVVGNLIVIVPYGILGVSVIFLLSEIVLWLGYAIILRDQTKRMR